MATPERSVLHVLPHPGGGGETYVDLLDAMPGYRFTRVYLAPSPRLSLRLGSGLIDVARRSRRHDLVHVHGEVAAGLCLPVLATRPSIVTLHGLHLVRRLSGLPRRAATRNLRVVVRAADRTICVSETESAELRKVVGPRARDDVVVVRNGVRLPVREEPAVRLEVREELGLSETEPVGIWVGSLDDRKDPLVAVRAAEQASVPLLIVGDGPLRPQVEARVREHARVLGPRSDVSRLLAAADFFVLTSRREGLPFSLLEAMARGLPSVVTETAENAEAVGDTGITAPLGDQEALVAALRRLAADEDEDERMELGARARRRVAELFDAEEMVRRTHAVYDEVLASRPARRRPYPAP